MLANDVNNFDLFPSYSQCRVSKFCSTRRGRCLIVARVTPEKKTLLRSRSDANLQGSSPAGVTSGQAVAQEGFPQYHRFERHGKVALLINQGPGWVIHCPEGVFQNPWTKKPWTRMKHAKQGVKALWRLGRWPEFKEGCPV